MKRLTILVFCGVIVWAAWVSQADAGLSVAPGIIEIVASRGDEATGVCKVTNTGTEKCRVTVDPEDWRKGFRGKPGSTVSDWLTVEPRMMDLGPGQSGEFSYHIKVAPNAAGEHTAQIFFTESAGESGGTQIQTRVGVILYVSVRETIRLEGEISDVKVHVGRDGDASIATCQVSVTNPGNVHIRPTGDVKLYDSQGAFLFAAVLNTGWGILPGESYTYQGTGRGPALQVGKYKAVATMEYGKLFKQEKSYTKEFFFEVDASGKTPLKEEKK